MFGLPEKQQTSDILYKRADFQEWFSKWNAKFKRDK
jgi:hypothetical protein